MDFQVVEFKNKLYLIGGYTTSGYTNDIYSSSDGVTWTLESADGVAPFSKRYRHQVVEFNNKLYLIGGYTSSGETNDIYSSSDGVTWT